MYQSPAGTKSEPQQRFPSEMPERQKDAALGNFLGLFARAQSNRVAEAFSLLPRPEPSQKPASLRRFPAEIPLWDV